MRYSNRKPRIIGRVRGRSSFFAGKYSKRKLNYRGTTYVFDSDIKKGNCSRCKRSVAKNEIKTTLLHHRKYNDRNVLANTIEVCRPCHMKIDDNARNAMRRNYAKMRSGL